MIVFYKELGFHMSRGRTKPYFVLRDTTSCVTTHDRYFQLPGFPSTVSNLRYLTSVLYNRLFHESDISFYSILFSPFYSIFFFFSLDSRSAFPLYFPLFPLHFPGAYARTHPPNARVNIIRCPLSAFPPAPNKFMFYNILITQGFSESFQK